MIKFRGIKIRDAVLLAAVAAMTGCGCTDDAVFGAFPNLGQPQFIVGDPVLPIAVPKPKKKVDVVFLIDDSIGFSDGAIPGGDGRIKSVVFQGIAKDVVAKLKTDLEAASAAAGKNELYDVAYGVARFEDFGGTFATATNDMSARPFILQQPLLRQAHPNFTALFDAALARKTSGKGNRLVIAAAPPGPDPATGIEALYQAATGIGLDGNANGNTTDSGTAAAMTTTTTPNDTGDVPTVTYVANGVDVDQEPLFKLEDPALTVPASGNIGGMGRRPNSLRYVLTSTDFATVTPFDDPVVPATVSNTPNGVCRPASTIPTLAFRSLSPTDPRFGTAATVGPIAGGGLGRHTLQQTIKALNDLNIEVSSADYQFAANRGGKPNQPNPNWYVNIDPAQLVGVLQVGETITGSVSGAKGTVVVAPAPGQSTLTYVPISGTFVFEKITGAISAATAVITTTPLNSLYPSGPIAAIPNPANPDNGPYTWASAMALLTGAIDPVGVVTGLPMVYNILVVSPPLQPITSDIREDLVERVALCESTIAPPALTPLSVTFTLTVGTGGTPFLPATIDNALTPGAGNLATVSIPRYYTGNPVPPAVDIRWNVQLALIDQNAALPTGGFCTVSMTPDVAVPGWVSAAGTVEAVATDISVEPPRATLRTVTAGCLNFLAGLGTVSDAGFVPGVHCSPFTFP